MRLSVCKIYKQNNHFVHYHVVEKLRLGHFSLESVVETFWWLESIFFPIYLLIFFFQLKSSIYIPNQRTILYGLGLTDVHLVRQSNFLSVSWEPPTRNPQTGI